MKQIFKLTTIIFLFSLTLSKLSFAAGYTSVKNHDFVFLMDYDTKEILLSKNADTRLAPSSMTKIMTAYVVFDQVKKGNISLNNECIIGRDAWRKRGSSMFLNYGDIVSIDKLVRGLLAVSGNDAAIALAQSVGGSFDKFIAMMNFKAKELGLKNSHFKNPHGLNQSGHYMSLRDLAILMSRFYEDFPEYAHYLSIEKFTYANITQPNRNPLMKTHYDGVVGGKTGYTNDGGFGVVASVKRNNRRLIAATNKARTPRKRTKIIRELFDYGFNNYKKLTIFQKDQEIASLKTWMGNKNNIKVASNKEISLNVPRNIDLSSVKVKVDYQAPLYAPIAKGQKIATLKVKVKNYKTLEYSLFAQENIKKARFFNKMKQKIAFKAKSLANRIKNKLQRLAFKAKKILANSKPDNNLSS